jgi:hypothetical protein
VSKMAKGRRHVTGRMNGTEAEYARLFLGNRVWGFEAITLRLADDCRYTPDFWVLGDDDVLEFHETKGHWREDARVKIRSAAEQFPWFRFRAFRKLPKGGGWQRESFGPADVAA